MRLAMLLTLIALAAAPALAEPEDARVAAAADEDVRWTDLDDDDVAPLEEYASPAIEEVLPAATPERVVPRPTRLLAGPSRTPDYLGGRGAAHGFLASFGLTGYGVVLWVAFLLSMLVVRVAFLAMRQKELMRRYQSGCRSGYQLGCGVTGAVRGGRSPSIPRR